MSRGRTAEPVSIDHTASPDELQVRRLLTGIARSAIDGSPLEPSKCAFIDWSTYPYEADRHQLGPLAHAVLVRQPDLVPERTLEELAATAIRERARHRARSVCLAEVLQALEARSIEVVVLKGAALVYLSYSSPALRPMNDVDVLVSPTAARATRRTLLDLGFRDEGNPRDRLHHHLPILARRSCGITIGLEVHTDALSKDSCSSISLQNLTEAPQPFRIDGTPAFALGHVDMLRHLAHHLFEPSWDGRVRLLGIIDLLRYALEFRDRIDWARLKARHGFVLNAFACLQDVMPVPAPVAMHSPRPEGAAPARRGETMRPLRAILARDRKLSAAAHELFAPPDWWLHAYYGVPPGTSLTHVRLFRHPWRVARWLGRRASRR